MFQYIFALHYFLEQGSQKILELDFRKLQKFPEHIGSKKIYSLNPRFQNFVNPNLISTLLCFPK